VVGQGSFSRELGLSQFAPVFPAGTINDITADFFGSAYAAAQDRQHLGIDVAAPAGSDVVSPVYGEIIFNNTSIADGWGAYVVIEDFNTGWQHIVGHIASDVEVGSTVAVGEVIGSIRTAGTGPHVHWGVNSDVVGAQGFDSADQQWGWGRAPESASISEATDRGWIDPLDLL
jgi:murein DD-endopeptidase MepM/ murein hydrolase activator NlpD